jgi:hypothetical protein
MGSIRFGVDTKKASAGGISIPIARSTQPIV